MKFSTYILVRRTIIYNMSGKEVFKNDQNGKSEDAQTKQPGDHNKTDDLINKRQLERKQDYMTRAREAKKRKQTELRSSSKK